MAARWKAYAPNTILKAVEVQDLADNGVIQLDTAADLASADLVNANVVYVVAEAKPYVRQAAGVGADKWQVFSGGLPGLGGWAYDTATTGSPTKHEYTDADGNDWTAYEWTGDGSCTTTDGLADTFMISAGGSAADFGAGNTLQGAGGRVREGLQRFTSGAHPIVIGLPVAINDLGRPSSIGTFSTGYSSLAFGGSGASGGPMPGVAEGLHTSITGTDIDYGREGRHPSGMRPNKGDGGATGQTGTAGIVIIRVPRANAKA